MLLYVFMREVVEMQIVNHVGNEKFPWDLFLHALSVEFMYIHISCRVEGIGVKSNL